MMRIRHEVDSTGRLVRAAAISLRNWAMGVSAKAAPQLKFGIYGTQESFLRPIPRIVWIFWDEDMLPLLVAKCVESARRLNPNFEINLIGPRNVAHFIPVIPPELWRLPIQKQANWFRLYLLKTHGGIWIDASIVLARSLDWVLRVQEETSSELVGFYIDLYTTKPTTPVLENWFIAAVSNSPFIAGWYEKYTQEIVMGGILEYLGKIRRIGTYDRLIQGIDIPDYLPMHLLAQELMQFGPPSRLALACAEHCAFLYHKAANWNLKALHAELMFKPASGDLPHFVKLRACDRPRMDRYILAGVYLRDSFIGRTIKGT